MPIHQLERTQLLHASLAEAWDFFSSPANLSRITPPALNLKVLTEVPARIHPGLLIRYRVRPWPGIPMTWLTEITHIEEQRYFVDEQRIGPYRLWHHEHHFEALGDGRVRMLDRVTYALPFGWLSEPIHAFFVRSELARIFAFRERAVEKIFGAGDTANLSGAGAAA